MSKRYGMLSTAVLTLLLGIAGCQGTEHLQTLPYPVQTESVTELSTDDVVAPETTVEASETSLETEPVSETQVETMELTVPFLTEAETTTEEETEEEVSTEEPTPQETRASNALIKKKEDGIYDIVALYEDAALNFRIRFVIPQIYTKNKTLFQSRNDALVQYAHANFMTVYVLRDLDIEYSYETMTENEKILSYLYSGYIRHLDTNDGQFRETDHSLHAFTMERATGKVYTIEEAYGMDRVYEAISSGNYTVISGKKKAFSTFSDTDLATLYRDYNTVAKDPDHYQDFYLKDGKVVVIIWVGNQYGNYVCLELNGRPLIKLMEDESAIYDDMTVETTMEDVSTKEETQEEESQAQE